VRLLHVFAVGTVRGNLHTCKLIRGSEMATKGSTNVPARVVLIDGVRVPFQRSATGYKNLMGYQLGEFAVRALMEKTGLPSSEVEYLIFGTTVHEVKTHNIAREVGFAAELPHTINAHTVSAACVSANQAITGAADIIYRGYADVALAGGVDTLSDPPLHYQRKMRQKFMAMRKAKGFMDYLRLFADVRPKDLAPEAFAINEFSTGLSMGQNADRLAKRLGISRAEQDEFAVRSHKLSAAAQESGILESEIAPVTLNDKTISRDNGPRPDTSLEKVASLRPVFSKDGTVTAANASFLTDGAAVVLLMSEDKARELGLEPKAYLRSYAYAGTDPLEELLLGPAYATPLALERAGLQFSDLDIIEIHEAFAAQMLAVMRLLESKEFAKEKFGRSSAIAKIDMDRVNPFGGSLSLGHPFGATGARLATTCANRLQREDGRFGLVAACGGGGCGSAMIWERA